MNLLEVSGLNSYYGDSHILFDVGFHVRKNERSTEPMDDRAGM